MRALLGRTKLALGKLENSRETGLSVNSGKIELVIFSRKHKIVMPRVLRLKGHALEPVDKIKYLGVILNRKLSWKNQIESVCAKAQASLWLCRRVVGKT